VANYRRRDHLPALRSALRDENAAVRKVAIAAVAQFDDAFVFDDLVAALADGNWEVRREATLALGRFPSEDAQAALIATLEDPAWQVVREAALSLSRLQADGGEAVATLLTHDLADLRIAGAVALGDPGTGWIDGSDLFATTRTVEFVNPPGSPSNASPSRD
jgi:HEAT repeat protein